MSRNEGWVERLKELGLWNTLHEGVATRLVEVDAPFWEPEDLLQVRYETVRALCEPGISVKEVCRRFKLSKAYVLDLKRRFLKEGCLALLGGTKLAPGQQAIPRHLLRYYSRRKAETPSPSWPELARHLEEEFGFERHSRSLSRAVRAYEAGLSENGE